MNIDIQQFVASYLTTAAWVKNDGGECNEFTRDAKLTAEVDCRVFIKLCEIKFGKDIAEKLLTVPGNDLTYLAPHCLFLNRNGHGSGFWDRENEFGEEYYNQLSELAHAMGGSDCYHIRGPKSKLTLD